MLDLLKTGQARRVLITVTSLVALLALGASTWINYSIHGKWRETLLETGNIVAGGALGGVLSAAFLIFISRYLLRAEEKVEELRLLAAKEGHKWIVNEMLSTSSWRHAGQVGRWVREAVIPQFRFMSKEDGAKRRIELIILDPDNAATIRDFAEYHALSRGLPSIEGLPRQLQVEILCTVLWAAVAHQHYLALDVELLLRQDVGFIRSDIGDSLAFETLPGSDTPILALDGSSRFHDYFTAADRKFRSVKAQARSVNLDAIPVGESPTRAEAIRFFEANSIACASDSQLLRVVLQRPSPSGVTKYS